MRVFKLKLFKMLSNLDILTNDLIQEQELRSAIISGLNATPKTLPNILLWDDAGHELFKQITKSRSYYGPQADREIIQDRVDEICRSLGDDGVLIELGAGYEFSFTSLDRDPQLTTNSGLYHTHLRFWMNSVGASSTRSI